MPPASHDLIVIGAGIAGAAAAWFASATHRVLLLEREERPGMHSTGRSAAMFMESYGPPQVRALTRASRAFLERPPEGFAATPLLRPRGALYIGSAGQRAEADALHATLRREGCPSQRLEAAEAGRRVPVLAPQASACAVLDPIAADIDVDALHQGFLRGARARGAALRCNTEIGAIDRRDGLWHLQAGDQAFQAPTIVNAAGAWADEVGRLAGCVPVGLQPRRRSAFVFAPPEGLRVDDWPCVTAIDESFYFKPDAGLLLGSPANADPVPPHDVMPEELDIALAIARIEAATTLRIRRPRRTWAGLRSFVADGEPVIGPDPDRPGFVWHAAFGGYGIQTSPAAGQWAAAVATGQPLPASLHAQGVLPERLAPSESRR